MSQKTNKLIVLVGCILVTIFLGYSFWSYQKTPAVKYQKFVSQCEAELGIRDSLGRLPPQRVCKIVDNSLKVLTTSEEMKTEVHPGDTIIISVALDKILKTPLYHVYNGQEVAKPQDQKAAFCFVIYPVLLEDRMKEYDSAKYADFYSRYLWQVYPSKILNSVSKGDNFICSNAYLLESYQKISVLIKIPSQEDLSLGYGDTKSYGLKIVMVPENIKNTKFSDQDVVDNYQNFIPIYLFLKFINFSD